mmetsp:Transcript_4535/g.13682  ORF Transcript_4535/g.13682 Transcript_4535/m.13682 type:complete len:290 (+) Transcript_4535:328-1197(+)
MKRVCSRQLPVGPILRTSRGSGLACLLSRRVEPVGGDGGRSAEAQFIPYVNWPRGGPALMLVLRLRRQLAVELLEVHAVDELGLEKAEVGAELEPCNLKRVLDDPPDDAVDPNPKRPKAVIAERQTLHGQTVQVTLWPIAGEERGHDERRSRSAEQDGAGQDHEEEALLGPCGEEREESSERHLHVQHRYHLAVLKRRKASVGEDAPRPVGIEGHREQQKGGEAAHRPEHGGNGEEEGYVPALGDRAGNDVVVTNGNQGTVVEQGDKHNQEHWKLEVEGPFVANLHNGN